MRATLDWYADGACKGQPQSLWFPAEHESAAPAKRICKSCPVRLECLAYAVQQGLDHGIWGGTTPRERRLLKRKRRRDERKEARLRATRTSLAPRIAAVVGRHGVRSGYTSGCRCEDCTAANRAYERTRRRVYPAKATV